MYYVSLGSISTSGEVNETIYSTKGHAVPRYSSFYASYTMV